MADTGEGIDRVLADLEQQAEGLHLRERDDEVAGLLPAAYARVDLESRLHGSVGRRLVVHLRTGARVDGILEEAGRGWFLLTAGPRGWVVLTPAVLTIQGLGERALVEEARPVSARLGPGTPLRDLADRLAPCVLVLADGSRREGRLRRVGADFVEVGAAGTTDIVPFTALEAVVAERG